MYFWSSLSVHLQELQRNLPILIYFGFQYSELEVITESQSSEVDVGCSCLFHQSKWQIINWDVLCFCQSWGGESVGSKTPNQFWNAGKRWGIGESVSPPLAQSNRVSWYTDKSETKHALTSCDIAQVKLKVFPVTVKIVEVMVVVADQNFFPLLQ